MDVPVLPTSLPLWAQIVIYGIMFLGVGAVYAWRYRSEMKKSEPDHGKQVVLQAASFADMSLFRQVADGVDEIRKSVMATQADTRSIRMMMEEDDTQEKDDARLRGMISDMLGERRTPRAPRRRARKPPAE